MRPGLVSLNVGHVDARGQHTKQRWFHLRRSSCCNFAGQASRTWALATPTLLHHQLRVVLSVLVALWTHGGDATLWWRHITVVPRLLSVMQFLDFPLLRNSCSALGLFWRYIEHVKCCVRSCRTACLCRLQVSPFSGEWTLEDLQWSFVFVLTYCTFDSSGGLWPGVIQRTSWESYSADDWCSWCRDLFP